MNLLCNYSIDWSAISAVASCITVIITGLYTCYTYQLLEKSQDSILINNKLTNFQINHSIATSFANQKTIELVSNCRNNLVDFDKDSVGVYISDLLNILEGLAHYYNEGFISLENLNANYGSMILYVGNNEKIVSIILNERETFKDVFIGFEKLYNKIHSLLSDDEKKLFRSELINN